MTHSAIIIHGTPSKEEFFSAQDPSCSNSHWIPWLQNQLIVNGIHAHTPEIPNAFAPDYLIWKGELERFTINKDSILIGHSCGAGFLCRWLSENKVKISGLFLVAPWLDPFREKTDLFFDFLIDKLLINRCSNSHLFYSTDDDVDVIDSTKYILSTLPDIKVHKFDNKGHFTLDEMGTEAFAELLETILVTTKG